MANKKISRRLLLKGILTTGGALSAAAFLPAKWIKPLVETGVLPVHARASAVSACTTANFARASGLPSGFGLYYYSTSGPTYFILVFNKTPSLVGTTVSYKVLSLGDGNFTTAPSEGSAVVNPDSYENDIAKFDFGNDSSKWWELVSVDSFHTIKGLVLELTIGGKTCQYTFNAIPYYD